MRMSGLPVVLHIAGDVKRNQSQISGDFSAAKNGVGETDRFLVLASFKEAKDRVQRRASGEIYTAA